MNAQTKQDEFFAGLGFKKTVIEGTLFGDVECFQAKDGDYYRLDIRSGYIAIEAANMDEAIRGQWEDCDLFDVEKGKFDETAKLVIEELKHLAVEGQAYYDNMRKAWENG